MITRRFGRTGLDMPVLSCGGMRYQHSWKDLGTAEIPADSQRNVEACIEHALELGITHIETARGYGTSEIQLGRILPRLPREQLIVQTKVTPQLDGDEFVRVFEQSLDNLGLDTVDLLALHGLNDDLSLGRTLKKGGSLEAALRLKAEGKARFVGFSTHGPLDIILSGIETDAFDYINLHWYFFDQVNAPAIEAATARDMGVFIISPSDKGGKLYDPPPKLVQLCDPLSPMAFNDCFCLSHPGVHTISIGASTPSDFDEHVRAIEHLDKAETVLPAIADRLHAELERVLGKRWMENWWKGLPRHERIPGGTNCYHTLRLYNVAAALDMVEYGRMRYNLLGKGDSWFPGERVDKIDWEALPGALKQSPVADLIPDRLRDAHALLEAEPVTRLSETE